MKFSEVAALLESGDRVTFRPHGNSMTPRIESGQLVTLDPDTSNIKRGDVVLARVHGNLLLHLVRAWKVQGGKKRYLIGNNHGKINGWTSKIYGKLDELDKR